MTRWILAEIDPGKVIPKYCRKGDFEDYRAINQTGYAVDATYTTSCAPPPMMEDLGLGSVAIARPASL